MNSNHVFAVVLPKVVPTNPRLSKSRVRVRIRIISGVHVRIRVRIRLRVTFNG